MSSERAGEHKGPTGTIATPARELLHAEYVIARDNLKVPTPVQVVLQVGYSVASQRNLIALQMFAGDWLLFIDSDMVFPPDALLRLFAHGEDKDIIGAVCLQKVQPFPSALWGRDDKRLAGSRRFLIEQFGVPFECGGLGMAFTLIRRRVFEKMPYPWFELGKIDSWEPSEDVWFCRKARRLGFKVWADPTIKVWHIGQGAVALGDDGPEGHVGVVGS